MRADGVLGVAAALGVSPSRVLSIEPEGVPTGRRSRSRIDARLFAQDLAVLLEAGVPLLEALQTLAEQNDSAAELERVAAALRDGRPLSEGLAMLPAAFDPLFVAMVAASERDGRLGSTLRDHAAYLHWAQALRARLAAAAVYPVALLAAGGAVVMFLLLYVLPRFASVFDGLGSEVPAASRWLMALGVQVSQHRPLVVAGMLAVLVTVVLGWRSAELRDRSLALAWRIPALAARLRTIALARLYRMLGLLLGAGVPAVPALRLVEDVVAAPLRAALRRATAAVEEGSRLSRALDAQGLATPVALRMLRVGEGSGRVADMLERAAAFHDEEIARFTDLLTRAVGPALMLVMGVVIGGIVVLMYLPIFTLMEQVQ